MYFCYVIEAVSWRPEESEVARNHHGVQFAKLYLYVLSCDDRRGTKLCENKHGLRNDLYFWTKQVKCYIHSETHLCGTWDNYPVNATTEDEVGQVPKKVSRTQEPGEKRTYKNRNKFRGDSETDGSSGQINKFLYKRNMENEEIKVPKRSTTRVATSTGRFNVFEVVIAR